MTYIKTRFSVFFEYYSVEKFGIPVQVFRKLAA